MSDCRCIYRADEEGGLLLPAPPTLSEGFLIVVGLTAGPPSSRIAGTPACKLVCVPKYVKLIMSSMFSKHFDWLSV